MPIVILGVVIGFILIKLKNRTPTVNSFVKEINDIMIEMTGIIMKFSPVGVFCLMARTFGDMGFETLIPLAKLILCVITEFAITVIILYPILIFIFTR